MEPIIFEGDILVVDRSLDVLNNQIAVVSLGGELLCKRLLIKGKRYFLYSENRTYKDISLTEEMDFLVFGKVTCIAREVE